MGHADRLIRAARVLSNQLAPIRFEPPVSHVYNPLEHAGRGYRRYLRRFADGPKRIVFLGMNPGPYGMTQTGVPFGEIGAVRDWLRIEVRIDRPADEHPKRRVDGFACTRSEVSGARLWGAIADHWHDPEAFFRDHFIANYCPLVFMEESGRNRTPDKLPAEERNPLFAVCDQALLRITDCMRPSMVIGVGKFAQKRAREVLAGRDVRVESIPHPSPASPLANRGWSKLADAAFEELGIRIAPTR